jgi:conjugative relaxase-like TrwC/TraI family protein
MSLHRLSAGAGYRYLIKHTACGDTSREAGTALTAYYTASGYPPGRWVGAGLAGLGNTGLRLEAGLVVTEEQMLALFGTGQDPLTGAPLGRAYPTFAPVEQRIAARIAALPKQLDDDALAASVAEIERVERERTSPVAVAGFDLTFTLPKSASVLWALAEPRIQRAVAEAHRAAVDDVLAFLEQRALFTRIGSQGCAQVATRGMVAAAFDHWDTRTGDPNLHTHVVIANKVQGPDGRWRSIDSKALHHAGVALSELYDDVVADHLATRLAVSWAWRDRGARRTPAFELDGLEDRLLAAFSTRSTDITAKVQAAIAEFSAKHGRPPTRPQVLRLRQQATLATRPEKTPHRLADLMDRWVDTARKITSRTPHEITAEVLTRDPRQRLRQDEITVDAVDRLAEAAVAAVMQRRSTWNQWNVLAEAARATRGLRLASTSDRVALVDRVCSAALRFCIGLDDEDPVAVPAELRRPDGASIFTRTSERRYSHRELLEAEHRLLYAHQTLGAPVVAESTARRVTALPQQFPGRRGVPVVRLAADQVSAVVTVASSGRLLDVLVGPAGTGKTTTLQALRLAWETGHGRGSVIGLAPSANAAHELRRAVGIGCETISKWLTETTGPAAKQRTLLLDELTRRRATAANTGNTGTVRYLDAARAAMLRSQAMWQLRPGQLVIVDEASLAGTLDLDRLLTQAARAGAKLLLVGDHAQLSAVDAGGAFGLLARTGTPAELRSLWRFRHRWEAHTTRRLRNGDPDVLDIYDAHRRLHGGPAETIIDQAYTAWTADDHAGRSAILVAADNHSVTALNQRVHTDRVAAGHVTGPTLPLGGPGCDGERGHVGIGDRILTRNNDRTLAVPGGGYVRNGSLWTVTAIHADGSLTVTPSRKQQEGQRHAAVRLPAAYVAEHVDLGYATTAHRAQGITVDRCHVLAAPGMPREAFYVAMTRGRDANTAYVATDPIHPTCDTASTSPEPRGVREVLTAILADSRAETSATETRAHAIDADRSLHRLAPIRETIASNIDRRRWPTLLADAGFTDTDISAIAASPAAGPLFAALRRGEALGHAMHRVVARLHSYEHAEPAGDLAAVLHHRVETWLATAPDLTGKSRTPATMLGLTEAIHNSTGDELDRTLAAVDALIDTRIQQLVNDLTHTRPAWLTPTATTEVPASGDPTRHLAVVAAYQDLMTGNTTSGQNRKDHQRRRIAEIAERRQHSPAHDRSTP